MSELELPLLALNVVCRGVLIVFVLAVVMVVVVNAVHRRHGHPLVKLPLVALTFSMGIAALSLYGLNLLTREGVIEEASWGMPVLWAWAGVTPLLMVGGFILGSRHDAPQHV